MLLLADALGLADPERAAFLAGSRGQPADMAQPPSARVPQFVGTRVWSLR
jgi:hypothetical protein